MGKRRETLVVIKDGYAEVSVSSANGIAWTQIDLEDVPNVQGHLWQLSVAKRGYYVKSSVAGKMHRHLLTAPDGYIVDHIDLNRLNNRRSNLRVVTQSQNLTNIALDPRNSTGYKGVTKRGNRFRARHAIGGKEEHIGMYSTAEEAAIAWDKWMRSNHPEHARYNFPREGERGVNE